MADPRLTHRCPSCGHEHECAPPPAREDRRALPWTASGKLRRARVAPGHGVGVALRIDDVIEVPKVAAARKALAEHDAARCGRHIESGMVDEDGPIPGCDCERHAGHDGDCYGAPDEAQWEHLRTVLATLDEWRMLPYAKLLRGWEPSPGDEAQQMQVLVSARGGRLASVYTACDPDDGWGWMVRGVNYFSQHAPTEAEAKAAAEARLAKRGWMWP